MMVTPREGERFDAVLVGGGLQNALIALALLSERPAARVAIVERASRLCGDHTWSFHEGDVPESCRAWVAPLVVSRWDSYDVKFPRLSRTLTSTYATTNSERVAQVVVDSIRNSPGSALFVAAAATEVAAHRVTLEDGTVLEGDLVVDARGPDRFSRAHGAGFQKFLGVELEVESTAPFPRPLLMDALVPQIDGYRFVYVLPFSSDRVLVEDTYFSDTPELDVPALRERALEYARAAGLVVRGVVREETGVLPLPVKGMAAPAASSPLIGGYAGGWFHPGTGYSFPVALRLAAYLATTRPEERFGAAFTRLVAKHRSQYRFAAFLNRMLFGAFEPEKRFAVLERFYALPEDTIARFYALETTGTDRLRILCGRPPRGMTLPLPWRASRATA